MNKLYKNSFQFDYFSDNFIAFEKDFYRYSNINVPLTFLTDDILEHMISTKNNYFRINAKNCKDNMDHYFIFRKNFTKENKSIILFEYICHKTQLEFENLTDNR